MALRQSGVPTAGWTQQVGNVRQRKNAVFLMFLM